MRVRDCCCSVAFISILWCNLYTLYSALLEYFKAWRVARLNALESRKPLPPFNPPKPLMLDGLRSLLTFFDRRMREEAFMAGVRRAFVTTGLVPDDKGACQRRSVAEPTFVVCCLVVVEGRGLNLSLTGTSWSAGAFQLYNSRHKITPAELKPVEARPWEDPCYLDAVAVIQGMEVIARGDGAVDPDSEEPDADADAEDAADSDTDGSDEIEN